MSDSNIIRRSRRETGNGGSDWKRVEALTDEDIAAAVKDDPDAAPLSDDESWEDAELVMPETKERITIRLDKDILDHFRKEGRYQTRINAVLRAYVERKRA